MARVTYVQKAQQRYRMVVVTDEQGNPQRTPVMNQDGTQRTTKSGRPVFRTASVEDRTQPLPPYTCDSCGNPIEVGTPYQHISPKSGPYGGRKLTRHGDCPTWQVWEYSSSLSARTAQISHDFATAIATATDTDDVQSALDDAANSARELAEEKREGASNIEEGFGHPTSQSEELTDIADQLDSWADEIESGEIPELPEPEESSCEECSGTGTLSSGTGEVDCEECNGTGEVTPDEPTEDQIEEWREQVRDSLTTVDECPV